MANRTRFRIDWRELPTRFRAWKALSLGRKFLWGISHLSQILIFYGIFTGIVLLYNFPETSGAVINGEQAVWTLLELIIADYELLLLLAITLPMFALLVIVPHRRVDEHGREVP